MRRYEWYSRASRLSKYDAWAFRVILFGWTVFFCAIAPGFLRATPQGIVTSVRTIFGDWAAHSIYTNVFALRPLSDWFTDHPLMQGVPFNYPFVSSLIAGLGMRVGLSRPFVMTMTALLTLLALVWILAFTYRALTKSSRQAGLCLSLFFLGSGLGWVRFCRDFLVASAKWEVLNFPPFEYAALSGTPFNMGSQLTCLLLPQRALPLGMGVVVGVLWMLHTGLDQLAHGVNVTRWRFFAAGLLVGVLPWFHAHSVIAAVALSVAYAVKYRRSWRHISIYVVTATCLGMGTTYALLQPFAPLPLGISKLPAAFAAWQLGWLANGQGLAAWTLFWLCNWGLFTPLVVMAMLTTRWRSEPVAWAGCLLFVAGNLWRFQMWDWDNTKIFIYAYLFLTPAVVEYLLRLSSAKAWWPRWVAAAVALSIIGTGLLESKRLLAWRQQNYVIWNKTQEIAATALQAFIPAGKVVVTSLHHNDWISGLTGAKLLLSYTSWSWSYGYDVREREQDIRLMYEGGAQTQRKLTQYGVDYLAINQAVRADFRVNEEFFKRHYGPPLLVGDAAIYKIR